MTERGVLSANAKLAEQRRIDRDCGAADDAEGAPMPGIRNMSADARVAHDVAQRVDAVVAARVGDHQRRLVGDADEARLSPRGEQSSAFRAGGRKRKEGRRLDQGAVSGVM